MDFKKCILVSIVMCFIAGANVGCHEDYAYKYRRVTYEVTGDSENVAILIHIGDNIQVDGKKGLEFNLVNLNLNGLWDLKATYYVEEYDSEKSLLMYVKNNDLNNTSFTARLRCDGRVIREETVSGSGKSATLQHIIGY